MLLFLLSLSLLQVQPATNPTSVQADQIPNDPSTDRVVRPDNSAVSLRYLALFPKASGNKITLAGEPRVYLPLKHLSDPRLGLSPSTMSLLDGPIRALLAMVVEADAYRGDSSEFVAELLFSYEVHRTNGARVDRQTERLSFELGQEPGAFRVLRKGGDATEIRVDELTAPGGYQQHLRDVLFSSDLELRIPKDEAYIVSLHLEVARVFDNADDILNLKITKGSVAMLRRMKRFEIKHMLGATLVETDGTLHHSRHLQRYGDGVAQLVSVLGRSDPKPELLQSLVTQFPAELTGATLRVVKLLGSNRPTEAARLLERFDTLGRVIPELTQLREKVYAAERAVQDRLLAQKDDFQLLADDAVTLVSPDNDDLVGGYAEVIFDPGPRADAFLRAELYNYSKQVAVSRKPPFRIGFKPDPKHRRLELTLKTYFADRTRAVNTRVLRTVFLGSEDTIQLVRLRTVATRGNNFLTDLSSKDFQIIEKKRVTESAFFRRDQEPLSIAILIDTSHSMAGEKLLRAQDAVVKLLNGLEDGDEAAVFQFDHKVMRLTDFKTNFDAERGLLYTLHPRLGTALYDGLSAAHHALQARTGNPVIIVVSDGQDTVSLHSGSAVRDQLIRSNTSVYSLFLGDPKGFDQDGYDYLNQLSAATGSITTSLLDTRRLEKNLARIYQELKSFYLIDFYSTVIPFNEDLVRLRVLRSGAKARYRRLDVQTGNAPAAPERR